MEELADFAARRDREEKNEVFKNRASYSLPVRIGHWLDEVQLNEEKLRLTKYKRDHCQLLLQKTKLMFQNLLKNVKLSTKTQTVFYNEYYQIKNPELPNTITPDPDKPSLGLYLSGLINEQVVEYSQKFVNGCLVTCSPDRIPCTRNTFQFIGTDEDKRGQCVYFGDDVYIALSNSDESLLYVSCEVSRLENLGGHLQVTLTSTPDIYCRFKMYHFDPQQRIETTGSAFGANTRVIIRHTASGRNLAGEYQEWVPTFFGAECTISCHTYYDTHHMEKAENIWMIVGSMQPDMHLYVRAAKGEDIPEDMLL